MSDPTFIDQALIFLYLSFKSREVSKGKISKENFKALLAEDLHGYDSEKAEEKFKEFDINEDGFLDFKEFCKLFVQVACDCHECIEYIMAQEEPAATK